jgi:hypothetical protein
VEVAARAEPRVIITTVWWQSQVLAPVLLDGKVLLFAPDTAHLKRLLDQLSARGVGEVIVLDQRQRSGPVAGTHVGSEAQSRVPFGKEGMMYFRPIRLR